MKPPKESATEVWSVLKKLDLNEPTWELTGKLRELNACKAWVDAVGDSIARRSAATTLARGTLHVVVESPAWKNELHYIEQDILRRVNARYHELLPKDPAGDPVKRLRMTIGALPAPPPKEPAKAKLPPPTESEQREVDERLANVTDPEVRAAARRFLLVSLRAERAERERKPR